MRRRGTKEKERKEVMERNLLVLALIYLSTNTFIKKILQGVHIILPDGKVEKLFWSHGILQGVP